MSQKPVIAVYVYPGWHSCPARDKNFPKGWREWDIVINAKSIFDGHIQPKIPCFPPYDDSKPETAAFQKELCIKYGIDLMIYGFFWSRGKRIFEKALDDGFLGEQKHKNLPFAIMWANRMPRGVLPVKLKPTEVIESSRLVYTDPEDFFDLIKFLTEKYFLRTNYFKIDGKPLFSIFDSTFFLRQIPGELLYDLREKIRKHMNDAGFSDIHLMAINPAPEYYTYYKDFFDTISHYVFLPEWKGDYLQDYRELTLRRINEWQLFPKLTGLSYCPSVSPGWDATPRGISNIKKMPKRYPWWPIVVNNTPELFKDFLTKALKFTLTHNPKFPFVSIASLNEWSEGHYLEPDSLYGYKWLEMVKEARNFICLEQD